MKGLIQAIRKHKKFLITAHVNPEGDSLCSQLAMKVLLGKLGKRAVIYNSDPVPGHYRFLPHIDAIRLPPVPAGSFDVVVVLDCPTLQRTGRIKEAIAPGAVVINIDHHISNDYFGTYNWVNPRASSAGEMVWRLFKKMRVPLTKEAALYLYTAILTDTGSFNYDNTTAETHCIAGELLTHGIEPTYVAEQVYERKSLQDIRFLGLVLSTLRVNKRGDVAYLEVTRRMLRDTGADIAKAEGLANYARSIDGVKVAALFREDPKVPGRISVSFRSRGGADVNKLASAFGGGGHVKAAGCTMQTTLADAERRILAKADEMLRRG